MGNYSRESTDTLPTDTTDLSTIYSAGEVTDVLLEDGTYVGVDKTNAYTLHMYKNSVSSATVNVRWHGKSSLAPSSYPVYLQVYNVAGTWETLDTESSAGADTDFDLVGTGVSTTGRLDGSNVITFRVYQNYTVGEATPFTDNFTRGDGALGSPWEGSAKLVISTNKVVASGLSLGTEILANPNFTGTYSSGVAPNWTKSGCTATESSDAHDGDSQAQQTSNTVGAYANVSSANVSLTEGTFYQASAWGKRATAGGTTTTGMNIGENFGGYRYIAQSGSTTNSWGSGVYQQRFITGMCLDSGNHKLTLVGHYGGTADIEVDIFDDASLKALTTTELIAAIKFNGADKTVSAALTVPSGNVAGVIMNLDDPTNPQNYVVGLYDGKRAMLIKVVAGVPTLVIAPTNTTYGAGYVIKIVKSSTTYQLYYNNIQVGTDQTIDDAGIISNTYHGIINTSDLNSIDDFAVS